MTLGWFSFSLTKETIQGKAQFLSGWRVCSMLPMPNKIILGRYLWQAQPRTKTAAEPLLLHDHRRMWLKTINMYEKTPRMALIYQPNMNNWLTIVEDCKKTFITHIILPKQQTHDWTLGGTKQEVQSYATTTVLLKPKGSSGNAKMLLPWKFHNDGERLLSGKSSSVDGGRGKDHPRWRPAWPQGSAQVKLV